MAENIEIQIGDEEDARQIETALLAALRGAQPQSANARFVLCARTGDGRLVAGATVETSYGWAAVKTLWVADEFRRRGIAHALMRKAEEKALDLGCHGAWLDTSNPDARTFYEKLGYTEFGSLANAHGQHPETHRRWFLKKALTET
ncbi:GNAT family N-acetyltransferase [Nitratireductor sp. XY-223]|uniref:GNAT family N-acetyltransferase n=1 Tax=Nitratireductor sp. XY-223 TaxID=2561926 RepID=UPI0010AAF33D|nr:GNAT family N-acetyltransferase [Nitratireductor sp. XY-223]